MSEQIFWGILFGINMITFPINLSMRNTLGIIFSGMGLTISGLGLLGII